MLSHNGYTCRPWSVIKLLSTLHPKKAFRVELEAASERHETSSVGVSTSTGRPPSDATPPRRGEVIQLGDFVANGHTQAAHRLGAKPGDGA